VTDEQVALIKDLYINKRVPVSRIAKENNLPYTSVYTVLNKIGCLKKMPAESKPRDQIRFDFRAYVNELILRCCSALGCSEEEFREYIKTPEGELKFEKAMSVYTPEMYNEEFNPRRKIKRPQKNLNRFGSKPSAATVKIEALMLSENGATIEEMQNIRGAPHNHICTLRRKGVKIVCICGRYYIKND
jgi:hypothetical protein